MTNRCRGCGAEILWIKTAADRRRMPVDGEPVWVKLEAGGKPYFRRDGSTVIGRIVGDAYDDDDPDANLIEAFVSHYATCPVGGQFRNRKPRTRAPGYR